MNCGKVHKALAGIHMKREESEIKVPKEQVTAMVLLPLSDLCLRSSRSRKDRMESWYISYKTYTRVNSDSRVH